jgi:hypothetical protein
MSSEQKSFGPHQHLLSADIFSHHFSVMKCRKIQGISETETTRKFKPYCQCQNTFMAAIYPLALSAQFVIVITNSLG